MVRAVDKHADEDSIKVEGAEAQSGRRRACGGVRGVGGSEGGAGFGMWPIYFVGWRRVAEELCDDAVISGGGAASGQRIL